MEERFITEVWNNIHEIKNYKDKTEMEKMELVAFSILVMIDGEHASIPPFALRPLDEKGKEGKNIAGDLHNLFIGRKKWNILGKYR
jgi:hypothetical protein